MVSLRPGVAVEPGAAGECVLTGPFARLVLRRLHPAIREALGRLAPPGAVGGGLARQVRRSGGSDALARWYYLLGQLAQRGVLTFSVRGGADCLATLVPAAETFCLPLRQTRLTQPHRLSRFAYFHRDGDEMVLESPLAPARVVLHDGRAAAVVHVLALPRTVAELTERVPDLPPEAAGPLLALLHAGGMLAATEDSDPALRAWEFHDLLFHARSREGRHDAPVGGTYPLAGVVEPPPALKPFTAREQIELPRPDLEKLAREDPPLARVQEQRRSVRNYAAQPITLAQLGEFLYRVGRVTKQDECAVETPAGPVRLEIAFRPYPAGGALYELELYAVVNTCEGLPPGLYHYDPLGHRLGRLSDRSEAVAGLLAGAGWAADIPEETLQVLVIVAARFLRIAWKYSGLAYALTLKHVGVLFQTMYLAATAMGLAPCALGTGDADLFSRAAGTDYYAETSVGEFLLGSRP